MRFQGFPSEALSFYEGLEADNSKAYFTARRQVYEDCVRAPFEALLAELADEFGEGRMFRPYRDTRFSSDKSPYKTHAAAVCERDGAVYYVHLSADSLHAASGYYKMGKDQLERYRVAVDDERAGAELASIVAALRKKGYDVGGHGDVLRSAPRGYRTDHPRIDLLRQKSLIIGKEWEPGPWLHTTQAKERVVKVWRDAKPLNVWLTTRVGPSGSD